MRLTPLLLVIAACLLVAAPAQAQGVLSEAAQALRDNPLYVHPGAERALSEREQARLRDLIAESGAGPMYIAVLPASARDEAGGDPTAALREIARELREPGVYAAVIGDSFRAGSVGVDVPAGQLAGRRSTHAHLMGPTASSQSSCAVWRTSGPEAGRVAAGAGAGASRSCFSCCWRCRSGYSR